MSKPTSVAETLRLAKEKIGTPDRWCKNALAKISKRSGAPHLSPNNPQAGAWCAVGALRVVDGPYEEAALDVLAEVITGGKRAPGFTAFITDFNDDPATRHRDIIRKFNAAIRFAEASS